MVIQQLKDRNHGRCVAAAQWGTCTFHPHCAQQSQQTLSKPVHSPDLAPGLFVEHCQMTSGCAVFQKCLTAQSFGTFTTTIPQMLWHTVQNMALHEALFQTSVYIQIHLMYMQWLITWYKYSSWGCRHLFSSFQACQTHAAWKGFI
jgi:hypothetical protein